MSKKEHWESVYEKKKHPEMSWFQEKPTDSMEAISKANLKSDDPIIDVGGGDTFLVDELLSAGYKNITLLDISEAAINRVKERLAADADKVEFIVGDILDLDTDKKFKFWHDRAALHFLKDEKDRQKYKEVLNRSTDDGAHVYIASFSEDGPDRCSGLEVKKYSESDLEQFLAPEFQKDHCKKQIHKTPFDSEQEFTVCIFQKK